MLKHLWQWGVGHAAFVQTGLYFLWPSFHAYAVNHPKLFGAQIVAAVYIALLKKSPLPEVVP